MPIGGPQSVFLPITFLAFHPSEVSPVESAIHMDGFCQVEHRLGVATLGDCHHTSRMVNTNCRHLLKAKVTKLLKTG